MKTKALISFAVTAKLICAFVFTYAKIRVSHYVAQLFMSWLTILTLKFTRKLAVIHKIGVIFFSLLKHVYFDFFVTYDFYQYECVDAYIMHNFEIVVLAGWVSKR